MFLSALPQPSGEPRSRMSRQPQQHRTPVKHIDNTVEVKSKFEAEYRRFGLKRNGFGGFQEFYHLLQNIHHIHGVEVLLEYADIHGDLLPINNDENFHKAVSSAHPVLRIIITKKGGNDRDLKLWSSRNESFWQDTETDKGDSNVYTTNSLQRRRKGLGLTGLRPASSGSIHSKNKSGLMIGPPQNFRQISSIIDVDILPESHRRVRLHKYGSNKPLGFYIRDGVSVRVTPQGVEKVPGVFISRLVRGGLAESTGLLAVNDEILEVNGIDVAGKSLDQVTDMMVANSHNLIVTVKPANQRNNVVPRGSKNSMGHSGSVGSGGSIGSVLSHDSPSPASQSNPITASSSIAEGDSYEEDDDGDVILENDCLPAYKSHPVTNSNSSTLNRDSPRKGQHSSIPQSVSMPNSLATSVSHSSTMVSHHNGGSAHSVGSSQESMKEDGNVITL